MNDTAERIRPHIPYMRRFGRALTGAADAGDDLAAAAIETVAADPVATGLADDPDADDLEIRVALFRTMVRCAGPAGPSRTLNGVDHPLERALAGLPELERRCFLLITLEELDADLAGAVLDVPVDVVEEGLVAARAAVDAALAADVLIVEDDAVIARDLAETVEAMGHRISGLATTPDEAMAVAGAAPPSVALVDLHLARGTNGKQTVQRLRAALPRITVIFVTAFAEELARDRAFALEPVIRKPFSREQIERAITQAVFAPADAP